MSRTLRDVFMDLTNGPLAGMSIATKPDINSQVRLSNLVNSGLRDLYTRYVLWTRVLVIRGIEGRTIYPLDEMRGESWRDAQNAVPANDQYIVDTIDSPFYNDVVKILKAYGPPEPDDEEEKPVEYDINNYDLYLTNKKIKRKSVFVPIDGVIQIPDVKTGDLFSFLYQARHPLVDHCNLNQRVVLPLALYEALEAWVASKVFGSMNGAEHRDRGRELKSEYEMVCQRVVDKDLAMTSLPAHNVKSEERGFI